MNNNNNISFVSLNSWRYYESYQSFHCIVGSCNKLIYVIKRVILRLANSHRKRQPSKSQNAQIPVFTTAKTPALTCYGGNFGAGLVWCNPWNWNQSPARSKPVRGRRKSFYYAPSIIFSTTASLTKQHPLLYASTVASSIWHTARIFLNDACHPTEALQIIMTNGKSLCNDFELNTIYGVL